MDSYQSVSSRSRAISRVRRRDRVLDSPRHELEAARRIARSQDKRSHLLDGGRVRGSSPPVRHRACRRAHVFLGGGRHPRERVEADDRGRPSRGLDQRAGDHEQAPALPDAASANAPGNAGSDDVPDGVAQRDDRITPAGEYRRRGSAGCSLSPGRRTVGRPCTSTSALVSRCAVVLHLGDSLIPPVVRQLLLRRPRLAGPCSSSGVRIACRTVVWIRPIFGTG